ncbi:MAG: energy-coupling factor transporter transmembrane component T [Candidatus Cloacimonadales bacterium]
MRSLNLRTILIMVILITSLSVIYQELLMQISLLLISGLLIFWRNPSPASNRRTLHRLKHLGRLIFTLMIFQILFRSEGELYFSYGLISITSGGISYGLISSLRFFLIILIAGLLFDIPYSDYLLAFKAWKFPYEISFMVASVIHFIPIFSMEFSKCREALLLRGIDLEKLAWRQRPAAYISLIFPVIAQAISDVQYRTISLELRGFRLHKTRTSIYQDKLKLRDWLVQISCLLIFLAIIFWKTTAKL